MQLNVSCYYFTASSLFLFSFFIFLILRSMPVYAIIKLLSEDSRIIQEKYNLESFSIFTRGHVKNVIRVACRELSEKMGNGTGLLEIREKLTENDEMKILTEKKGDSRVIIITDGEYNSVIGHKVVIKAFNTNDYDQLIKEYKEWEDKDTIRQIEGELKKCETSVVEGLSSVLERGESLSDLVERSEELSSQTKFLFKTAKKRNRCC